MMEPEIQRLDDDTLQTVEAVAAALGVSAATIVKAARDGRLRGYRIGSRLRFARADVEQFMRTLRMCRGPERMA